jgi:hypothetical protein
LKDLIVSLFVLLGEAGMAFVYDREKHRAVDPETGEAIYHGGSGIFVDEPGAGKCTYVHGAAKIPFVFIIKTQSKKWKLANDKEETLGADWRAFIVEDWLYRCLQEYRIQNHLAPITEEEYTKIKGRIAEGLYALITRGGMSSDELRSLAPGFSVHFTPQMKEPTAL